MEVNNYRLNSYINGKHSISVKKVFFDILKSEQTNIDSWVVTTENQGYKTGIDFVMLFRDNKD